MNIAKYIDHTLLKPDSTLPAIQQLCKEALENGFKAVCVPPYYVKSAARLLDEKPVRIATVIGYPMGYTATAAKVAEIQRAVDEGVHELDIVVNINAIKDANWKFVHNDIESTCRAAHLHGRTVKMILETALLTEAELYKVCEICTEVGVDYVKTSTGMNGGATVEMVSFLRKNLPLSIKIKASGGIKTPEQAQALIVAGANRLGSSSGVALLGQVATPINLSQKKEH